MAAAGRTTASPPTMSRMKWLPVTTIETATRKGYATPSTLVQSQGIRRISAPGDHRRHPSVQARHRRHGVVEGPDEFGVELEEGLCADRVREAQRGEQAGQGDRLERRTR